MGYIAHKRRPLPWLPIGQQLDRGDRIRCQIAEQGQSNCVTGSYRWKRGTQVPRRNGFENLAVARGKVKADLALPKQPPEE